MAFLAVKKLVGKGIVLTAARHNLREIQAELGAESHIDASRMCLNKVLAGPASAAEVDALASSMMAEAGVISSRRDMVRAIEVVISLASKEVADETTFFDDALLWASEFFKVPVLSAVVHRDEAALHCHVLILPLVGGRMNGSDLVGGPARLRALQSSFRGMVCVKYGIASQPAPRRLGATIRRRCADAVIYKLLNTPNAICVPNVKAAMLPLIEANPLPLMEALELPLPKTEGKRRKFVDIMIQHCSPEKAARH